LQLLLQQAPEFPEQQQGVQGVCLLLTPLRGGCQYQQQQLTAAETQVQQQQL
jgi:hypothetical protein